ncbi:hypothetical protein QFC22_004202 [Naganishia vaughanmartiniae]|uniref:Uncharacterized protein n=1 Tax=Naganishia vaughanmartiniae TaxID=1424756 RepID=A0ACC2X4E6_9TREE|nr:hypothetical protein QFC22_004202 [Naganishia vaughanmartiniae]
MQDDKPRLARIVFDFLASMDQEPRQGGVEWNGFVGQFSTRRIQEEEKCRSYIEFHRRKGEESVLVCAQATAQALNPFRESKTFNWIELQLDNDAARFPQHDNTILHRILGTLLPHYLVHAPRRLCPPAHGMGDVIIEDESDDLLAGLKRVVPAAVGVLGVGPKEEERDVVEYYIKRYPEGTGAEEDETWRDSHDEHVVYYKEFAA